MQEMTVLGQKMQFFTKWGSDDKVHTDVWMPDRKIMMSTLLWFSPPQLYSVRGDEFRDRDSLRHSLVKPTETPFNRLIPEVRILPNRRLFSQPRAEEDIAD
jgi:hypothetical protein